MALVSTIPALFRALVDDAAIFPPGDAPLDVAVAQHASYRQSPFADFVGPFVVNTAALSQLDAEAPSRSSTLDIVVVTSTDRIEEVIAQVDASPGLALAGLDVRLGEGGDPTGEISRVASLRDRLTSQPVYVELPRPGDTPSAAWLAGVTTAARANLRLKFRLGGTVAEAFASEHELAAEITAAVSAHVPFKCTAGLHRAVRHRDPATGFEHHGYLNVMAATMSTLEGHATDEVAAIVSNRAPEDLASRLAALTTDDITSLRTSFTSYGSCSITEPLADLVALGLLSPHDLEMT